MNTFYTIETHYITNSRAIEIVFISRENQESNKKIERIFYVYNYEGNSFRFFRSIMSLIDFFNDDGEDYVHFENEEELDAFLYKTELE